MPTTQKTKANQCEACRTFFMSVAQRVHHQANASRLCKPRQAEQIAIKSDDAVKAAKEFAAERGHYGRTGGWIYDGSGQTITQGWFSYWSQYRAAILNKITRDLTAFRSFGDMIDTAPNYSPTIRPKTWRERFLADAYDLHMYRHGDLRRAYRGQ